MQLTRLCDGEAHQPGSFWSACIKLGTISLNQTLHGHDARSGSFSLSAHPSDQRRGACEPATCSRCQCGSSTAGGTTQRVPLTLTMKHTQTRHRTSRRRRKTNRTSDRRHSPAVQRSSHEASSMTRRVPLHVVPGNRCPRLQSRGASSRVVDHGFWYVPDASIAPSELVRAALFTQPCVLCGRHFKRLLCTAVTAALRTGP